MRTSVACRPQGKRDALAITIIYLHVSLSDVVRLLFLWTSLLGRSSRFIPKQLHTETNPSKNSLNGLTPLRVSHLVSDMYVYVYLSGISDEMCEIWQVEHSISPSPLGLQASFCSSTQRGYADVLISLSLMFSKVLVFRKIAHLQRRVGAGTPP